MALTDSPLAKAIIFAVSTIFTNVLTGALMLDIIKDGKIYWIECLTSPYFWLLLITVAVIYWYYKNVYEQEISKFSDPEFCREYVTKNCLPEQVKSWKRRIKDGDTNVLETAKQELEEFLQ